VVAAIYYSPVLLFSTLDKFGGEGLGGRGVVLCASVRVHGCLLKP
jgi:hypothetical protein